MPLSSVGRLGAPYYDRLGYVPSDVGLNESAARTLEYAFDDFCNWRLGKALGKPESETAPFAQRARNYRNLFDASTGFMRGAAQDGSWQEPFRPDSWGGVFTEGSAWHWTWSVFHDPAGLAALFGGDERMAAKLDSVFTAAPTNEYSYYGTMIHEIAEMVVADMGQYAHGNQPIQHMIYLYDWVGQPWKTQYWARQTMDRMYRPGPGMYCGDEDNGQTSAWYVMSAMGLYSVAPGTGQLALGSPLFDRVTLRLENGKTFAVEAERQLARERLRAGGAPEREAALPHVDRLRRGHGRRHARVRHGARAEQDARHGACGPAVLDEPRPDGALRSMPRPRGTRRNAPSSVSARTRGSRGHASKISPFQSRCPPSDV